ncbi:MAG TPA: sigma 54-interacting transcriptional regulator [Spirochaetia bacterium]|nr:sigma 54-interacting transcriptional regulator [Spirochaetia bacterium]
MARKNVPLQGLEGDALLDRVPRSGADAERLVRRLEAALLRTEATLASVLDATEDAVCVVDTEERVTAWNRKAEQLWEIKAADILGRNINEFFPNLMVTRVARENREVRGEYHQPLPGTHVLINAVPISAGGAVLGGVSAEKDITEIVHLNRALTKASLEVRQLQEAVQKGGQVAGAFRHLLGHHPRMRDVIALAGRAAPTDATVLIRGESGTGKEILARAVHDAGRRAGKPFIVINCGAIPHDLFESEIFGYEEGAFTGANRKGKPGLLELAEGGTVFLDEIGELPVALQVKLLRVLQDRKFYRVGGYQPVSVDVRVIAATNRQLKNMISSGLFREDLYYRLNVINLEIPPLRERQSDIPELTYHFLQEYGHLYGKEIEEVPPHVMASLISYPWPGNVRELKNTVERLVILTEGNVADTGAIPGYMQDPAGRGPADGGKPAGLHSATERAERETIFQALQEAGGNRTVAAGILNIPRSTLYYKMNRLGLLETKKDRPPD